jgi:hypothetical protein
MVKLVAVAAVLLASCGKPAGAWPVVGFTEARIEHLFMPACRRVDRLPEWRQLVYCGTTHPGVGYDWDLQCSPTCACTVTFNLIRGRVAWVQWSPCGGSPGGGWVMQ